MMKMDGYKEARIVGQRLRKVLVLHPLTKENAKEWMSFLRTVSTEIGVLYSMAVNKELKKDRTP